MTEPSGRTPSIGALDTPDSLGDGQFSPGALVGKTLRGTWGGEYEYEVIRVLGGGYGVVLVCKCPRRDSFAGPREQWCRYTVPKDLIAIKILQPTKVVHASRFADEIRTLNEVAKASGRVVPIFGVERFADWGLGLVMPYFPMGSLRQPIATGTYDVPTRVFIWLQLVLGLKEISEQHPAFVHGDIKPENVLLDADASEGFVLSILSDLGLSRLVESGKSGGTRPYMSPEVRAGDSTTGPSADVFSLGVMLYELMTGRMPFTVQADGHLNYSARHSWPSSTKNHPSWIKDVADRCLSLDAKSRPSYAEIVAAARPHTGAVGKIDPARPWIYHLSAVRELDQSPGVGVRIKFDKVHAELQRDVDHLLTAGFYDEAMARIRAMLYDAPDSPLFRALRMSDDELFGEGFSTRAGDLAFTLVTPLWASIMKAMWYYATAFLHGLGAKMEPAALIPNLLPGLALGEVYIRRLLYISRLRLGPDEILNTFGNVHLFYRTAYAAFLAVLDASEVEWIRARWRIIEDACRAFYDAAPASLRRTYDNIFTENGTNGKMIAAVAAQPVKSSVTRAFCQLLSKEAFLRRLEELAFVVSHRNEYLFAALELYAAGKGDALDAMSWARPLYTRLIRDAIWSPERILRKLSKDDLAVRPRVKGLGRIARMTYGQQKIWVTKGTPEYGSGDGLDELDIGTSDVRPVERLPDRNVLCCHCDDENLWIGTGNGLCRMHLQSRAIERLPGLAGPIFEIVGAGGGKLWLGTRGAIHLRAQDGRLRTVPVQIAEVHRIVETKGLLFCGGDSREGLCFVDKGRLQSSPLPNAQFQGYVRDLYSAPGFVGVVGNDHIVVDPDDGVKLGGYRVDDLTLSAHIHDDFLAIGDVKGLRLISRALGMLEHRLGTVFALCSTDDTLFAAATDTIYSIERTWS